MFFPFSEKNGMTLRHDLLNKGMYKRSAEFEKLSKQKCFLLSDYLKYSNFVCFVKQKQKLLRFFSFKLGVRIHRKFSVKITIYYQGIPFHSSCLGIIPYCFTKGILKHETNKKLTKKKLKGMLGNTK